MNDLRYALRALRKSPGFALIAIATLSLGIGMNTAMFSLLNTMFLRPLPFEDSASLVRVYRSTPQDHDGDLPPADVQDLRAAESGFGEFATSREESVSMAEAGGAAVLQTSLRVSPNYLGVLRVRPEIGRTFRPGDGLPGSGRVAVISHALWQSRFAGAPDIVGRVVRIDGEPHDIIGVLPPAANDGRLIRDIGVFRVDFLTAGEKASRTYPQMRVIGRRSPSVSAGQAKAFVAAVGSRVARDHAKEDGGAAWRTTGLVGSTGSQTAWIIVSMLVGLSTCVLLIACSNLANFILARTIERSQELSVRSALGASLFHLVRPLALESLALACAGGCGALLVDIWCSRWLSAQALASGGSSIDFPLDWRVLCAAVASSLFTALVFGTAPALLIARINVNETLKSQSRGSTTGTRHRKLRSLLVVGQFAMAMTLLVGAAFLAQGAGGLVKQHFGWNSADVVVGSVNLPKSRYDSTEKILAFQRQLLAGLRAVPGADSAALAYALPYNGGVGSLPYLVEGRPTPPKGREATADYDGITPDYFRVTGGRIVAGRAFTEADNAGASKVVIISESMARALFPDEVPLGRRIRRADEEKPEWRQVVGVSADARPASLYEHPLRFQVYHPLAQEPWQYAMFAVRAEPGALKAVMGAIGPAVVSVNPDLPVENLMTADAMVERSSFDLGMLLKMLGAFAVLGLSLAALGIYGVIARTVVQRTPEIGIRMALGATAANVRRLVLGSGLRLAIVGSAIGLAGGFALTRLLGAMMPAVAASPFSVIGGSAAALAAVALLACYVPARAATRIDPAAAIRAE